MTVFESPMTALLKTGTVNVLLAASPSFQLKTPLTL
jgi:hypothetical protein